METKATEEGKNLEMHPRRTLRRRGSGMWGKSMVEQGRSHGVGGPQPP